MGIFTGLVSYADDGKVFRKVILEPGEPDSVLDDPKWVTFGCNPARQATMHKVLANSPEAATPMTGTP